MRKMKKGLFMLTMLFLLLLEMPAFADGYLTCNISISLGQILLTSYSPLLSDSLTDDDFTEKIGDVLEAAKVPKPEKVGGAEKIIRVDEDDLGETVTEQPKDEEFAPEATINTGSSQSEEG
ncbi:hypothetical protein [Enterococcus sp. AZ109]|uniref:hypothetical protein n=1 Tax=Enterococcus sp. AZ109 TaxID=2774634 RepID=UPI003F2208D9